MRLEKRISLALEQIAWKLAAGAPQIDLEGEGVFSRRGVQHPLRRRVGDETAVPIILAFDLGGRQPRWQRAAGYYVLRADFVGRAVEIGEVSGPNIDDADAEAHSAVVDQIKVHEAFERRLQRDDLVVTEGFEAAVRIEKRGRRTRFEKAGHAAKKDAQ